MKLHSEFSMFEKKKSIYVSNFSAQLDGKLIKGRNFFFIFASPTTRKVFLN